MNRSQIGSQVRVTVSPLPCKTEASEEPLPIGEAKEVALFDLTADDRAALIGAANAAELAAARAFKEAYAAFWSEAAQAERT